MQEDCICLCWYYLSHANNVITSNFLKRDHTVVCWYIFNSLISKNSCQFAMFAVSVYGVRKTLIQLWHIIVSQSSTPLRLSYICALNCLLILFIKGGNLQMWQNIKKIFEVRFLRVLYTVLHFLYTFIWIVGSKERLIYKVYHGWSVEHGLKKTEADIWWRKLSLIFWILYFHRLLPRPREWNVCALDHIFL